MTCWRCGRVEHTDWCSDGTPNDCTHCGGNPCRWWCDEAERSVVLNFDMPPSRDFDRVPPRTEPAHRRGDLGLERRLMHHLLRRVGFAPLAGVRTHAELDEEIAQENRAIARIEQAIDEYVPPTCAFCTAPAFDECTLCERPMCEDDSVTDGVCIECDAEVLS